MADSIEFSLEGVDELVAKLNSISLDMKRKGGRYALRKAAQIVRDAAIANAKRLDDPETASDISKNIAIRWNGRLFKKTGDLGFRIGVLGGAKITKSKPKGTDPGGPGGDTRHWAYIDLGTKDTAANPFMRSALSQNISQATDTFIKEYDKAIDRAIARANGSSG